MCGEGRHHGRGRGVLTGKGLCSVCFWLETPVREGAVLHPFREPLLWGWGWGRWLRAVVGLVSFAVPVSVVDMCVIGERVCVLGVTWPDCSGLLVYAIVSRKASAWVHLSGRHQSTEVLWCLWRGMWYTRGFLE